LNNKGHFDAKGECRQMSIEKSQCLLCFPLKIANTKFRGTPEKKKALSELQSQKTKRN